MLRRRAITHHLRAMLHVGWTLIARVLSDWLQESSSEHSFLHQRFEEAFCQPARCLRHKQPRAVSVVVETNTARGVRRGDEALSQHGSQREACLWYRPRSSLYRVDTLRTEKGTEHASAGWWRSSTTTKLTDPTLFCQFYAVSILHIPSQRDAAQVVLRGCPSSHRVRSLSPLVSRALQERGHVSGALAATLRVHAVSTLGSRYAELAGRRFLEALP